MLRAFRTIVAGVAVLVGLASCNPTTVEVSPDPSAVPSGEPTAQGPEATGPITVVASGVTPEGLGWRYLVYESADGLCEQLELAEIITNGCGDLLPADGDAVGSVTVEDPLGNGTVPVHGMVIDEVFTVWMIDEGTGSRYPAPPVPLDGAGLEGQAFITFLPPEVTPTHVQALARSGDILQTVELP